MARTPAAARLTDAHRLAQSRLGAITAAQTAQVWTLLDMTSLDATTRRWLTAVEAIVRNQAEQSARLSAAYLSAYRRMEVGSGEIVIAELDLNSEQIRTALTVTGPVKVKNLTVAGRTISQASEIARAASSAAAQRHALNGGRSVLTRSIEGDRRAQGWARRASGGACAFCAMLASRGGEFGSERSAEFEAHDGCGCTAEPIYSGDDMDPQARAYRDLWDQSTADVPAGEKIAAYRAALAQATP